MSGITGSTSITTGAGLSGTGTITSPLVNTGVLSIVPQKSAAGAFVDFSSIPASAKRITVSFYGVSTNGISYPVIQLGTGGVIATSGYLSASQQNYTGGSDQAALSTGFVIDSNNALNSLYGEFIISHVGSNQWVLNGTVVNQAGGVTRIITSGGACGLSGVLDSVRITTALGVDLFDAGFFGISYEM